MATGNDEDSITSTSGSKAAKLYASIAVDYNAAKSNPFKGFVEEATFSSAISDIDGGGPSSFLRGHVLDLGCGSGHYCRILKNKWNATIVHGVDVSEHMLAEARRHEVQTPRGIQYMQQDLLSSTAAANIVATFFNNNSDAPHQQDDHLYDLVTAEYLFPYAANRQELDQLCLNAASLVKSGGRFVSIVSICSNSIMSAGMDGVLESNDLGWAATWEDSGEPHDGMLVELTLFGDKERSSRVSFPNYLWTKESIDAALKAAGFGQVEWRQMVIADDAPEYVKRATTDVEKTPMGVFVARRL